ncbi:hypothetical protein GQ54DRAFT_313805 [Martensiomyces pterosporus]|nr:hypothetical protein GQ54DRAFT_313805 [Martensiomyces pterosporus]
MKLSIAAFLVAAATTAVPSTCNAHHVSNKPDNAAPAAHTTLNHYALREPIATYHLAVRNHGDVPADDGGSGVANSNGSADGNGNGGKENPQGKGKAKGKGKGKGKGSGTGNGKGNGKGNGNGSGNGNGNTVNKKEGDASKSTSKAKKAGKGKKSKSKRDDKPLGFAHLGDVAGADPAPLATPGAAAPDSGSDSDDEINNAVGADAPGAVPDDGPDSDDEITI